METECDANTINIGVTSILMEEKHLEKQAEKDLKSINVEPREPLLGGTENNEGISSNRMETVQVNDPAKISMESKLGPDCARQMKNMPGPDTARRMDNEDEGENTQKRADKLRTMRSKTMLGKEEE